MAVVRNAGVRMRGPASNRAGRAYRARTRTTRCALRLSQSSSAATSALEGRLRQALQENGSKRSVAPEDRAEGAVIGECIDALELDGGVRNPTSSGLLDGRWRLLFTTRPGTSSPIQRAFTGEVARPVSRPDPAVPRNADQSTRLLACLRVRACVRACVFPFRG